MLSLSLLIYDILRCAATSHPITLASRSVIELGLATATTPKTTRWEFPKIGGPNIVP